MNLVAKEYVACKRNGDGVLLLSEFAGAAAEMGEALLINSFDEDRTADVVSRALTVSKRERDDRMQALHVRVLRNNVFRWGDRFVGGARRSGIGTRTLVRYATEAPATNGNPGCLCALEPPLADS
jgi:trehalose-6-phosphate synthase